MEKQPNRIWSNRFNQDAAKAVSKTDWPTPWKYFDVLDDIFGGFTLDACANAENRKCERFIGLGDREAVANDALKCEWNIGPDEIVFMNPPYGRGVEVWYEKAAVQSAKHGIVVVGLVPATTANTNVHETIFSNAADIWLVEGRINYVGSTSANVAGSMIVVWANIDQLMALSFYQRTGWPKLNNYYLRPWIRTFHFGSYKRAA